MVHEVRDLSSGSLDALVVIYNSQYKCRFWGFQKIDSDTYSKSVANGINVLKPQKNDTRMGILDLRL